MFAVPGWKMPRVFVPEVSRNDDEKSSGCWNMTEIGTLILPWEPKTFIFMGYDPYIEGLKPSCFMVLGSKGIYYIWHHSDIY